MGSLTEPADRPALEARYLEERNKRLRADGNEQYVEVTGQFARFLDDPYVPAADRDPLVDDVTVAFIGGGFAGLVTGAKLKTAGIDDVRIIEKGGDFGGTWYWNRYPGAQCDTASFIYMPLLEETGHMPTEKYAHAPEILDHCRRIGEHFGLYENACFSTEVTGLEWDAGAVEVDHQHEPRRPDDGAVRRDGHRSAPPSQAPRHSGARVVRRPQLPHQPMGLRLHRR